MKNKLTVHDLESSLNGVKIGRRRTGTSTRIIDNIIQMLFNGKKVAVKDEPNDRSMYHSNMVAERVIRRIKLEHPNTLQYLKREKVDSIDHSNPYLVFYLEKNDDER